MYKIMDYTYLFENCVNKNIESKDIFNKNNNYNLLHILCYHVTNTAKYPFLQFMLEKIPFCNNFIKEEFILPFISFDDITNIEDIVIDKVNKSLAGICSGTITKEMYKGIVLDDTSSYKQYALINITGIDLTGLKLCRNSPIWFVMPSEIINTKHICNIKIDEEVTELFTSIPTLGLLHDPITSRTYIIPDVAYTGDEYKKVEFNSVFGNVKSKEYDSCSPNYYFYKAFGDAVRYGGWTKNGGTREIDKTNKEHTHNSAGRLIVDNDYGRYINGGINRYALFIEGNLYLELESEFSLNDDIIDTKYPEPTLSIFSSNLEKEIRPDILVKNYENSASLSCHTLNKALLHEKYIATSCNYMIL